MADNRDKRKDFSGLVGERPEGSLEEEFGQRDRTHLVQAATVQQSHQLVEVSFCDIERLLQGQQRLLHGSGVLPHALLRPRGPPDSAPLDRPRPQAASPHPPPRLLSPGAACAPAHQGTGGQLLAPGPAAGSGCWPEPAGTESASAGKQREDREVRAPSPLCILAPASPPRTCSPGPSPPSSARLPCPHP